MNKKTIFCMAGLGLFALLVGCNGSGDTAPGATNTTAVAGDPGNPLSSTNAAGIAAGQNDNVGVPAAPPKPLTPFELPTMPMDSATLMGLLPLTIRGYEPIGEANNRTNYQDRVRYTYSERKFKGEDGSVLVYRLVDSHKTNVTAHVASAIINQPGLDEDSDTVFELVSEISGYPGHIKVLKDRGIAKFQLMVENRMLVELTGIGIDVEKLEPMLRFFDLALIQEHTKEEIVQGQYKARQRIEAQQEARAAGRK